MRTLLRRCTACARYTMKDSCPACSGVTRVPVPARFSPEDKHGVYRRRLLKESRAPETGPSEAPLNGGDEP